MRFDYELTDRIGTRATLGLIVLQPDETIEHDFRRMLPIDDVTLYVSRIPSGTDVSGDSLAEMRNDLPDAARLLPRGVSFDVVGYGCTSGTSVIGADAIAALVGDGCETDRVTEPVSALIAACQSLNVKRLAFLSPYVADVSATLRATLADAGISSPVFGDFAEAQEAKVARIDKASIIAGAVTLASQGGATTTVYFGDDVTDEDVFVVLGPDDVGVKVGQGETAALNRVADPGEVSQLLTTLAYERAAHCATR